jgi:regulator of sigma E protease
MIGIRPYLNTVKAVRGRAAREGFIEAGDQIVGLERAGTDDASEPVLPVRDHDEFARALEVAAGAPGDHRLAVVRGGRSLALKLPPDADAGLAKDVAFATEVTSRRVRLMEGYPAALAGIADGAEIVRIDRVPVADWAAIKQRIEGAGPEGPDPDQRAAGAREIEIVSITAGVEHVVRVTPRLEYVPVEFGLVPVIAVVERSYPLGEAVGVGISSAGYMLKNVYLTLKKILVREVSASNLSGILTIAYVSRSLAESGVPTLFFFLAVLSLNLAFLNLLPIPILDGGHLFFLVVEKIKGSPVSERILGFSQLVGLVLVLALLLFVTYNDLRRLFS